VRAVRAELGRQRVQPVAPPPPATTRAPSAAKRRAMARPKPAVAPVTNTIMADSSTVV
jgi:hypothetical protein